MLSTVPPQLLAELSEGLEAPVQLAYLVTLMGFLVVGAYLVVRQVLIRRELEEAAKVLGERVRTGDASSEVRLGGGGGCGLWAETKLVPHAAARCMNHFVTKLEKSRHLNT
jgi:hypothetical protein